MPAEAAFIYHLAAAQNCDIVHILRFPPSSSVAKERLDKLKELCYVRRCSDYYSLTPKGEVALEDYLLEQNRQQPQSHHKSVFTKENIMFVFKLLSCVFAIAAAIKELLF